MVSLLSSSHLHTDSPLTIVDAALSGLYCTPIVSTAIGMLSYHYLNEIFTKWYIRRHNGIFEPEARLPLCYVGSLLMFAGQM
jgi:hypothetical protein